MSGASNDPGRAEEAFNTKRWCRNVLDVMAASRRNDPASERWTFLCAAVAMDWMIFADKDGLLFRAAQDTADAVGAAESNVREAARCLERAGLAERPEGIKKQTGKKSKGRDATTYRLRIVDISRLHGVGKSEGISAPRQAENIDPISAPMQAGFSAPMQATNRGRTLRDAGARVNAPPAPAADKGGALEKEDDDLVLVDEVVDDGDGRVCAPITSTEAAPHAEITTVAPSPAADQPSVSAPENEKDGRGHGRAVTLADLDRLAEEERLAQEGPGIEDETPAAVIGLADVLAKTFGLELDDPDQLADDLTDGFPVDTGDEAAAARAADVLTELLIGWDRQAARPLWEATVSALAAAVEALALSEDRGKVAVEDLTAAVAVAAARRRGAKDAQETAVDQKQEASHEV